MTESDDDGLLLGDLVAAARRYPGNLTAKDDPFVEDWALVDPSDRVVVSFAEHARARDELLRRFNDDARVALKLRLIRIRPDTEPQIIWPDGSTALERAGQAASRLTNWHGANLIGVVQLHHLRGVEAELHTTTGDERVVLLDWPDGNGEWQRIGVLSEQPDGTWVLLHPHGADRPDRGMIEDLIAAAINDALGHTAVSALDVRRAHPNAAAGPAWPGLLNHLICLAIDVARRLGRLDDRPGTR